MPEDQETSAFLAWLSSFELSRPVSTIADLSDGAALFDVLFTIDPEYFRHPSRPSTQLPDNWPLRFTALKRLFRLITQYFSEVLRQPTAPLELPDLQAIAKDYSVDDTLKLCRLTIVIAVQSQQNKSVIERIQNLKESHQHALMHAIETVISKLAPAREREGEMTDDDHYYEMHVERSRVLTDKETVEKVYETLLEEHRTLQGKFDDATAEKEDALNQLRDLRDNIGQRQSDKPDVMLRAEIDRLRVDLQKSEDNLNAAETEADKQSNLVIELNRKIEDLQHRADEAARLKDQVDEYKHAAEKLQKTENVMEKYKKKLEESADLRRRVKALEDQNATLVDKNESLEEEYRKVAAFKPLMESYKHQVAELETKGSARSKDMEALKYELEQTKSKLKLAHEEREKDSEALELYQERVRELELGATPSRPNFKTAGGAAEIRGGDEDFGEGQGLGGELDDALTGTTMTDLKLQIRKLKRDLEAARSNQAEASRLLVLENLLEDATRMKARYESDYLAAHREKLVLQSELEDIRSGKALGDGPEAAIALRQRLNESVDELDTLRKEHAEAQVKLDSVSKELTIAKSDLNLVNKDQLDILSSLRESVNQDKRELEEDVERLQKQNRELSDKNKMQLEQINGLLMEKVSMQSEGLGQRERMLEREREFGDLRQSLSGKDVPEDIKQRLLGLHEDNTLLKEQLKTNQEKLNKARQFIKSQDKLFKEEHAKAMDKIGSGQFEEAEGSFRSQIKILEEEVTRLKRLSAEAEQRYRREQQLMLSHIHGFGMKLTRQHLSNPNQPAKAVPNSWLGQQRRNLGQTLRR